MPPRARRSVIWYRPSRSRPTKGSPTVVAVTPAPNTVGKLAVLAVASSLRVSSYGPGHGAPGPGDSCRTLRGCTNIIGNRKRPICGVPGLGGEDWGLGFAAVGGGHTMELGLTTFAELNEPGISAG